MKRPAFVLPGIYAVELPHGAVNPHHVFTPGSFGPFGPHDLYGHEAAID
jgi:hypothetical protein